MKKVATGIATIGFTALSALVFIIMSVLFFFFNVWVLKVGANLAGFSALDGNWVVLSASLLSAATILSAALQR